MNSQKAISILTFIFILTFISPSLYANGAFYSYSESGELITEPFVKRHCQILHENLSIDLRPIQWGSYALVTAQYDIFLDRAADSLLFVFVAASKVSDRVVIELNGLPVAITKVDSNQNLPDLKIPVVTTPWGEPDRGPEPEYFKEDYVFCKMSIPQGKHKLVIRYKSRATKTFLYHTQSKTKIHTLSYALYPAKNWRSFGALVLEVKYPLGWEIRSNIDLFNEDHRLIGNFRNIPDDFLHLHIRYPEVRAGFYLTAYEIIVIALLVLISYLLLGKMRRFKAKFIRVAWFVALGIIVTICYLLAYLNKDIFFRRFITDEVKFPGDRVYMVLGTPVILVFVLISLLVLNLINTIIRKYKRSDMSKAS